MNVMQNFYKSTGQDVQLQQSNQGGGPGMWMPLRPAQLASLGADSGLQHVGSQLEDRHVLAELSQSMLGQYNRLYTQMNHMLGRERARHSSDISLMMRKVDRDLKDTSKCVHGTFKVLTDQLSQLAKEVENGHKQVMCMRAEHQRTKEANMAQAQYVEELEQILESQGEGLGETLRRLNAQEVGSRVELNKMRDKMQARQRALEDENVRLKASLRRMQDQAALASGAAANGAVMPPCLPEMPATWTMRAGHHGPPPPEPCDIVGSMLASSGKSRKVKSCQSTPRRAQENRKPSVPHFMKDVREEVRAEVDKEFGQELADWKRQAMEWKTRAEASEDRCARQRRLLNFASVSQLLLRNVFEEIKTNWHIRTAEDAALSPDAKRKVLPPNPEQAPEILDAISRHFCQSLPQLGNFAELLSSLQAEAMEHMPQQASMQSQEWPSMEMTGSIEEGYGDEADAMEERPDVDQRTVSGLDATKGLRGGVGSQRGSIVESEGGFGEDDDPLGDFEVVSGDTSGGGFLHRRGSWIGGEFVPGA